MELGDLLRARPARSRRGVNLQRRLTEVASNLGVTSSLIPLTQYEVDRLHSFRLLAHSEIQSFVEGVAENLLAVTERVLGVRGQLTHAGHHLVVYSRVLNLADRRNSKDSSYPPFRLHQARTEVLHDRSLMENAVRAHRRRIADNNGVKASNLRRLLMPLGFREYSFRPGLLDLLDAFGSARGKVAHNTGVIGAIQLPSGSAELAAVQQILPGLLALDNFSARLLIPG